KGASALCLGMLHKRLAGRSPLPPLHPSHRAGWPMTDSAPLWVIPAADADVPLKNLRPKQRHRRCRCPRMEDWGQREEKRCLAAKRWEKSSTMDSEIRSDGLQLIF